MASVANMTRTLIDSGCKHIIPVRVSYNFFVSHCAVRDDALQRNKMKFSVHKGDLLLCAGSHFFKEGSGLYDQNNAYPPVVSTIVDGDNELSREKMILISGIYSMSLEACATLKDGHISKENIKGIVKMMRNGGFRAKVVGNSEGNNSAVLEQIDIEADSLYKWALKLPDFRFMGFSLGLGYAHPSSGDNVVSSMIGGMMTVRNGDFPVKTGDRVMWYFYFEKPCFTETGYRDIENVNRDDLIRPFPSQRDPHRNERYIKMLMQNGVYERNNVSRPDMLKTIAQTSGKLPIALVKPYFEGFTPKTIFPYDKMRVFGKAVSNARPYEGVDILICTQSI